MIDKLTASPEAALADIPDGATVMIGGFGNAGMPSPLIDALIAQGAKNLTIVNNNAGNGDTGLAALIAAKRVRKVMCSFPRQADSWHFDKAYKAGELELELIPQGTLAERIRAAGAGIGAFFVARVAKEWGWGFPWSPLFAIAATTVVATFISFPAVRIRGLQFAIVTFSGAIALEQVLFRNPKFTGMGGSAEVPAPKIFGAGFGIQSGNGSAMKCVDSMRAGPI